jgi:N-acetylglucosamine-6-phosphate deacetylase
MPEPVASPAGTPFLVHGARKVDVDGLVDDFWFASDGGVVTATGTGIGWRPLAPGREILDARGHWLTPGFIDLHAHGGGGHSFEDGPEEISSALATHRAHGTTRSVISLVAGPVDRLATNLNVIADLAGRDPLVLGAHLEGPFLAPGRRGAHDPAFLREPDVSVADDLIAAARGTLRLLTIAPELPNAFETIPVLTEAGVVVAVGHTEADYPTSARAFELGARVLTHAFNAMPGIAGRAPGPVVAALDNERVVLELVLDSVHVDPHAARLLFTVAPHRVALITDAMAAAASVDGDYRLGGLDVTVRGGRAVLAGTSTIAGSTLTQDIALALAVSSAQLSLPVAVAALTATPARVLGLDHRLGRLASGYAADAVILDHDWRVQRVWADGRVVSGTPHSGAVPGARA